MGISIDTTISVCMMTKTYYVNLLMTDTSGQVSGTEDIIIYLIKIYKDFHNEYFVSTCEATDLDHNYRSEKYDCCRVMSEMYMD